MSDASLEAASVAAFEAANTPLLAPMTEFLRGVVRDPARHALFLNTLSLLEHLGSHKIMATQHGPQVEQATLKHLAEETRHAFFLKRKAEQLARRPLAYVADDLMAPAAARAYFQKLEVPIKRSFAAADRRATYLHMSLVVEFRAAWFYRLYQAVLQEARSALSLRSLIAEEEGHLAEMATRLDAIGEWQPTRLSGFCDAETALFGRLLARLGDSNRRP